jgi:hypothetical protein
MDRRQMLALMALTGATALPGLAWASDDHGGDDHGGNDSGGNDSGGDDSGGDDHGNDGTGHDSGDENGSQDIFDGSSAN